MRATEEGFRALGVLFRRMSISHESRRKRKMSRCQEETLGKRLRQRRMDDDWEKEESRELRRFEVVVFVRDYTGKFNVGRFWSAARV